MGVLAVVAVGAWILPKADMRVESHQVNVPTLPSGSSGAPAAPASSPVIIDGSPTSGQVTRVRVVSPLDSTQTLLDLKSDLSGTTMYALGSSDPVLSAPGVAAPILIHGDPTKDPVLTFTVQLPTGDHWVRVDRGANPAVVTTDVQNETIEAPVAVQGDPTDPKDVAVYNLGETPPKLLLQFHDNGDGTATVRYQNATSGGYDSQTVPTGLVLVDGSPLGPYWRVTIKDPTTHQPSVTFSVPLDTVRAALAQDGVNPDSYLSVADNALPDVQAYKAVTDGNRTLGPDQLDGKHYVSSAGPVTVYVDVKSTDVGVPVLLLDTVVPPGPATQSVQMSPGASENGYTRYTADVPPAWIRAQPDGGPADFAIAYQVRVAKEVTQQLVDDNNGAGYAFLVDAHGPSPPKLDVGMPDAAQPTHLAVSWASDDKGSGVAAYHVEAGIVGPNSTVWIAWLQSTPDGSADFTGQPGKAYQFRAYAVDQVGNRGIFGVSQQVAVPGSGTGVGVDNPPTVQLLQPTGGEKYLGVPTVTIAWKAGDPDGTVPAVNLYVSPDGGATWQAIASPKGEQYVWNVSRLPAGDYRVKVEATDGTLSDSDVSGKFHVDNANLATADSIGGPGGAQAAGGQLPAGGGAPAGSAGGAPSGAQGGSGLGLGGDGTLMFLGFAAVLVAVGAGLVVWRVRKR